MGGPPLEYPVQLGLAYIILAGYLVRTLFVTLRLPASVGVIISGFIFSYFFQADILQARDHLQELAFFLVLLTAGLEISLLELRPHILLFAVFPASMEVLAIAAYGVFGLHYSLIEGLCLGTVLVAIGDGLVIPKMKELGVRFVGHPMPKLMFTWAPLEASFVLTLFGILVGLSHPASMPDVNMSLLAAANVLRIFATIAMGAVLGSTAGWLVPRRTQLHLMGRQVFTGSSAEAFLMVLGCALVAHGLGCGRPGHEVVPMRFSPGSAFQPELLVIVTGSFFAAVADHDTLHEVEGIMGGVWVFGQLVLFSMLGSRTTPEIFPRLVDALPCLACGLPVRGVSVFFVTFITRKARGCEFQPKRETCMDALFCFMSTMPRATIQGALGAVPITLRFFQGQDNKKEVESFIFVAARLYIICTAVCGMIILGTFGPMLLKATANRPPVDLQPLDDRHQLRRSNTVATMTGPEAHHRQTSGPPDVMLAAPLKENSYVMVNNEEPDLEHLPPMPKFEDHALNDAFSHLAKELGLDAREVLMLVEKVSAQDPMDEPQNDVEGGDENRMNMVMRANSLPDVSPHCLRPRMRRRSPAKRILHAGDVDMDMDRMTTSHQFEAPGSLFGGGDRPAARPRRKQSWQRQKTEGLET